MTTISGINKYESNKKASLSVINSNNLVQFLYMNSEEIIGKKPTGEETSLKQEVAEVARMSHIAYIDDGVNYYHTYSAYRNVSQTAKEKIYNSKAMYVRAGKKILFLNAVSKRLTGHVFLQGNYDKNDAEAMRFLVDSFEWCITHYDELQE